MLEPFYDPRGGNWVRIGDPTVVQRVWIHPAYAEVKVSNGRHAMQSALAQGLIDRGRICGLAYELVGSAAAADWRFYLADRDWIGRQVGAASALGTVRGRDCYVSPLGHDGRPHALHVATRLPMHELGHAEGWGHTPNHLAMMDPNASTPIRYPNSNGGIDLFGLAGYCWAEIGWYQRKYPSILRPQFGGPGRQASGWLWYHEPAFDR